MPKVQKRGRIVRASGKKSVRASKVKPKLPKPTAAKVRLAKSADKIPGIEKSIRALRAVLKGINQRLEAIEVLIEPFDIRVTKIENDLDELNCSFDTRVDQAIVDIAERIENQRIARRRRNMPEPSSGALACVIPKFQESGTTGLPLHGSFGSNS